MKRYIYALFACVAVFASSCVAADSLWTEDFSAAMERAKTENKSVMLLFTGSDWCPPCKYMEKNVFSSDEFKSFAKDNLVCVMADFSRDHYGSTPKSKKFKKEHTSLSAKYKLEGFPTIILINPKSEAFVKSVGAEYSTPEKLGAWVSNFRKK